MAGSFYIRYPSSSGSNASVGTNGVTAPTSSTEVAGQNPSGNLQPLKTDASGNLFVTIVSAPAPINSNGLCQQIANLTTTAQSFTPPTNAVGFILEAESGNAQNIRWALGSSAPTTTFGMLLEPGRDTGFVPCSKAVQVIAVAGTNQSIDIQWVMSA